MLHLALKFTIEKEQNNSWNFLDVLVEKEGTGFHTSIYRKPKFTGQYIRWNSCSLKTRKTSLIKTLVQRARTICSKTKLGPELDKIKKLLIPNGYRADVILSCINRKLANFAAEKTIGPAKCPVYPNCLGLVNVSSKFENQISTTTTSCYYAVKPLVVYNTRVMQHVPTSIKKKSYAAREQPPRICKNNKSKLIVSRP